MSATQGQPAWSDLGPDQLRSYLRAAGWAKRADWAETASVWSFRGGEEILVPSGHEYLDYSLRVGQALRVLQRVESRDVSEIVTEIRIGHLDVVTIDAGDGSGSPTTGDAIVQFVRGAVNLIKSAALASVNPQVSYRGRKPVAVEAFMRSSLLMTGDLGQQRVRLLSPPPRYVGAQLAPVDMLSSALAAVNRADVPGVGDSERIDRAVHQGVSTNFCTALVSIANALDPTGHVRIVIARPVHSPRRRAPEQYLVGPAERERIERWGQVLRWLPGPEMIALAPPNAERTLLAAASLAGVRRTLVGTVVRLNRGDGDAGEVTIRIEGDRRPPDVEFVRARLRGEDYRDAVVAHLDRTTVTLNGTLFGEALGRDSELVGAVLVRRV